MHFVTLLPKTRSGKLLRRSIQALAEGRDPGDLTTIEDPGGARADPRGADFVAGVGYNSVFPQRSPSLPRRFRARPRRTFRWRVVTRGDATDSVHYGSVAVVDRDGRLLFAAGDPHYLTDDAQRAQAAAGAAFRCGGGVERFGFSAAQVALLCASHSGEPRHVEAVADMLRRADCTPGPAAMRCTPAAVTMRRTRNCRPPGVDFTPLQHNCSGKHSGMLAYCRHCGATDSNPISRSTIRCSRRFAARWRT